MEIIESVLASYGSSPLPKKTSEAMASVPFQQYNSTLYSHAQALESGTAYTVLNKPFFGGKCAGGKDD